MTEIKIARPGERVIQGDVVIRPRVSLIMLPHSAVGGLAPSPRKLSPASSIIIVPISSIDVTRIGPTIFGNMCLNIILLVLLPDNLAALRKGVSSLKDLHLS